MFVLLASSFYFHDMQETRGAQMRRLSMFVIYKLACPLHKLRDDVSLLALDPM